MSTDAAAAVPKPGAKRRRAPTDPIERVNRKNDEVFIAEHLLLPARQQPGALDGTDGGGSSPADWTQWTHPRTRDRYRLHLARTANLSDADLQACFDLIDETSREDYEQSSFGWKPSRKLAEMRSPDLRYILVRQDPGQDPDRAPDGAPLPLCGFVSLMPTYEDGFPVVYCYEIHLKPDLQGTGLARVLMGLLENVAINSPPITKVMLTCFLSNQRAFNFYKKLGFAEDEISPKPRKLRYGKVFVPDYVIMSKAISRQESASSLVQEG